MADAAPETPPVCELFALYAEWRQRFEPMPHTLDRNDEQTLGEWTFTLNASAEERGGLPGLHLAVGRAGLPLGMLSPFGGLLMAGAEDAIIKALKTALQRTDTGGLVQ